MPLDKEGRIKRAEKAGKASGKARSAGKAIRDANICRAFIYLSSRPQGKPEMLKAIEFLAEIGISPSLKKKEETPYRKLADALGLTRQRIDQIVKKSQLIPKK